jgi:hypothetical protein
LSCKKGRITAITTNGGNSPTYQWFKNGQAIPNATTAVWTASACISFTTGDNIFVKLNSNAACTQPSTVKSNTLSPTIITATLTGIKQNDRLIRLNVYPNPNTGEFILAADGLKTGSYQVLITNVLGQTIYERSLELSNSHLETEITLVSASGGMYNVSLRLGNELIKVMPIVVRP